MDWYAEAEFTGPLTRDQLEEAAGSANIAHYNEHAQVLRLRSILDAKTYTDAVREALGWVTLLPAVHMLNGPDRLLVESTAARAREMDFLGAAEVAARLGVSTARVRQLEERPDFPKPVLPLAGGRIWRAEDIDAFNRTWTRRPGRPSKVDPEA
ncbi:hypothetical protein OOJ91_34110 [Micromonospora lupini]|uniref:helix-turn-helix transcriptional regulator n=1 Tax=Micromonospora lupini TaxID=285679 RepID=UPI0022579904|nr:hypothetical protein [Micromonospora lupini]MCX5070884.1 hypothetical protein [Micromonospora lupini]